jgi:beta-glucosidase
MREDDHEMYFGLTFWAPNINIFRDPRWGRGQETYGEDPYLTARMAVAFVTGMQGEDPGHPRLISTPKHYAVHSGPEPLRHAFNVDVSAHDLEDTYLPAFRAAVVEGHAQSVMCAYNAIDGAPACASSPLLADHLRQAWHFPGYVVSDCGALNDVTAGHHYAPDLAAAAARALKAGTDLECGFGESQAYLSLPAAVRDGLVSEAEVDAALARLLRARFQLGMFDPPQSSAYGRIPYSEVDSPAHRQLSLRAARESMVLLKNAGHLLPLQPTLNLAVIGPTAELLQSLQGNYTGTPPRAVSPLAGIEKRFARARVRYAQGAALADGLPMPIERTALRPASGAGEGLTGEYFASADLSGSPVLSRVDRTVNFNWDKARPVPDLTRNDYSVRWSGRFVPPAAGDYKLGARISACRSCKRGDRVRLFVDGQQVVDSAAATSSVGAATFEAAIHCQDTQPRSLRLEYFHGDGSAGIDLTWQASAATLRAEALQAARASDVILAFVGLSPSIEGEEMPVSLPGFSGGDRTSIELPASQEALLEALGATGKPLVVVLQSGSALAVGWAAEHAGAVLAAWYPGEEGGTAIAATLAGDSNPGGRLPVTFYAGTNQLPSFDDYHMQGRTYRYFAGTPLFPFGHGLSYTHFAYSGLSAAAAVTAGEPLKVEGRVKNTGPVAGDEVVQLYLTRPQGPGLPLRELVGFRRVHLARGASAALEFTLDPRWLAQVDAAGNRVIVPGTYSLWLGGSQPLPGAQGLSRPLSVSGTLSLPK